LVDSGGTLVVSRTRTSTIGRRDFAMSGPATWNSLPVELQTSVLSTKTFVNRLKGHLFGSIRRLCLIVFLHSFIHSFIHRYHYFCCIM